MKQPPTDNLSKVLERVSDFLVNLSFLSLLLMTVLIILGVTMRYLFNAALNWTDEFAAYSLVWLVFFGVTHTFLMDGHIKVDFFYNLLPDRLRLPFELGAHIVGMFFALLLLMACFARVEVFWSRNTHSMSEVGVPLYVPALPMVLGSALLLLVFVVRTFHLFVKTLGRPE